MHVIRDREFISSAPRAKRVVTIGVFDGVHIGHRAILKETVARAKALGAEPAVLTFTTHPRTLLAEETPPLICSVDQRIELLEKAGIQFTAAIPFDESIRKTSALSFLTDLLGSRMGAVALVLGHDGRFGKHRKGDAAFARERGWEVAEVPAVVIQETRVSSGQVRSAVSEARMADASTYLGREFNLRGTVVRGDGRGRSLGFGTANLQLHHDLKPPRGVYSGYLALDGGEHMTVVNIGTRPTFDGAAETVEVHVPGWHADLYDRTLDVFLLGKVRDERKFKSPESLKSQIACDIDNARALYLARNLALILN
ncbi:MAG: riboflavin biosynthesis protein RibF [Planctomycetes bacterium]|nr:riboflavin biosynthesis protein RibF [Planctomycetota bacterium]